MEISFLGGEKKDIASQFFIVTSCFRDAVQLNVIATLTAYSACTTDEESGRVFMHVSTALCLLQSKAY